MTSNTLHDQILLSETKFSIEIVRTHEQLHEVYRLRHQVYCIERGFEAGVDGEETDEFDARSRHILLRHLTDGTVVGTVRLVGHDPVNPSDSFPMQRLCAPALLCHLPLATSGEVSRFAISKQRRLGCADVTLLRLALVRGLVQLSKEMGVTHWLAVMERTLVRLNMRNEIHFDPIGPLVSYHGIRQPMAALLTQLLGRVHREQFPTWDFLTANGMWAGEREKILEAA